MPQEASSRLYLAVLLRRRPRICEAVVMGLAGSKFLDLYIPDLGIELRVHVGEIAPAPVYGDWDSANKFALDQHPPSHSAQEAHRAVPNGTLLSARALDSTLECHATALLGCTALPCVAGCQACDAACCPPPSTARKSTE